MHTFQTVKKGWFITTPAPRWQHESGASCINLQVNCMNSKVGIVILLLFAFTFATVFFATQFLCIADCLGHNDLSLQRRQSSYDGFTITKPNADHKMRNATSGNSKKSTTTKRVRTSAETATTKLGYDEFAETSKVREPYNVFHRKFYRFHAARIGLSVPKYQVISESKAAFTQVLKPPPPTKQHIPASSTLPTMFNTTYWKNLVEDTVTIVVKHMSRFRTDHMTHLHTSIRLHYPRIKILVGDDTSQSLSAPPAWAGHPHTELMALPPDCGVALGRNILVGSVSTPHVLLLDDDFVFTGDTRLELLLRALSTNDVAVVGGSLSVLGSYGLHASIDYVDGTVFFRSSKAPVRASDGCRGVDAVTNFFMAHTAVLRAVRWHPLLKVGEHEAFFLALKLRGYRVLECPHVSIEHDMSRSKAYVQESHRNQLWRYADHICEGMPGLTLLRSLWWSVVCDHQLYCEHNPYDLSVPSRCYEGLHSPDRGALHQLTPDHSLAHGMALAEPAKPAPTLHTDLFLAVISHCGHSGVRRAFRSHFRSMTKAGGPRVLWRFFVGSKHAEEASRAAVAEEAERFSDVVLLDADDRYRNLTNKIIAAMRWSGVHVNASYVVKLDDDVFLNPGVLWHRLRAAKLPQRRLLAGAVARVGSPVIRWPGHKWSIASSVYSPDTLPRYTNGPSYVVSLDVAQYLGRYQEITAAHPFPLEDVFVSIALAGVGVYARSIPSPARENNEHGQQTFTDVPFLLRLEFRIKPRYLLTACAVHPIKHPAQSFALLRSLLANKNAVEPHPVSVLKHLRRVEYEALDQLRQVVAAIDDPTLLQVAKELTTSQK